MRASQEKKERSGVGETRPLNKRPTGKRAKRRGATRDRTGVGSVEVLPSGRFKVRVWVDGKRTGDTHNTREDAERQRATLAVMHFHTAKALPPEPEALTLAAWGKTWLERREELGTVRNAAADAQRWHQYLTGTPLDRMALDDIRPTHVRAWLDATSRRMRLDGKGRLSAQTVRHAFNVLRSALRDALCDDLIASNPCEGARLPKSTRPAFAYLKADEVHAVEAGAPGVPEAARRVFVVAIYTGLREGELIALQWGDVTLKGPKPELHVQRSHDGPPKNGKARKVPLVKGALDALRALWQEVSAEGEPDPDEVVFPSALGFQRHRADDFGWSSRKRARGKPSGYREALGVPAEVRFHDLRHTCATHLVAGTWFPKMPLDAVRDWLGHSSVKVTERYAHALAGHLHELVASASNDGGQKVDRGMEANIPRDDETAVRPARIERATYGLEAGRITRENKAFPLAIGQAWDASALPRELALGVLRAVDEGAPAGAMARELALDVLRVAPADGAAWQRAVAVLEGGALRMRHAVELAGMVVDAVESGTGDSIANGRAAG